MDAYSGIPFWGYQESLEELKNKLWATICELEELKNNAREEIRKKEDSINQLIQLLKTANQERDEAKDQLQILLAKLAQPKSPVLSCPAASILQSDSPQLRQAFVGSSSLTESENLTDSHNNHHSQVSSPTVVDSSSAGASAMNFADPSCNAVSMQDDVMKALFERLAKRPLPEKGALLKAVIDAGPILNTLLVAGSLPRWRNPPPLKPLLVPPISIRGDGALCNAKRPLMEHCAGGSQQCMTGKRVRS